MDLVREEKDGDLLLKIEGAMSIYNAAALREELIACFEQYKSITLDLAGVNECDVTGIQILISARRSSDELDKSFEVIRTSSAAADAVLRAGLNMDGFQNFEKEKSDG